MLTEEIILRKFNKYNEMCWYYLIYKNCLRRIQNPVWVKPCRVRVPPSVLLGQDANNSAFFSCLLLALYIYFSNSDP